MRIEDESYSVVMVQYFKVKSIHCHSRVPLYKSANCLLAQNHSGITRFILVGLTPMSLLIDKTTARAYHDCQIVVCFVDDLPAFEGGASSEENVKVSRRGLDEYIKNSR